MGNYKYNIVYFNDTVVSDPKINFINKTKEQN